MDSAPDRRIRDCLIAKKLGMTVVASSLVSSSQALKGPNKSAQGNALGSGDDPEDDAAQGLRARISWSAGFIKSFGIQVIWAF